MVLSLNAVNLMTISQGNSVTSNLRNSSGYYSWSSTPILGGNVPWNPSVSAIETNPERYRCMFRNGRATQLNRWHSPFITAPVQLGTDPLNDILDLLVSEGIDASEDQEKMCQLSLGISGNELPSQITDMQKAIGNHIELEQSSFYKQRLMEHQKILPLISKEPTSPIRDLTNSRLAHLGMISFDQFKTQRTRVMNSDTSSWFRDVRSLDRKNSRETIKVALLYIAPGMETDAAIFESCEPSRDYSEFVGGLGWEVGAELHSDDFMVFNIVP